MHKHEGETDCKACKVARALLAVGCAEHNEDEDACEHELSYKRLPSDISLLDCICAGQILIALCEAEENRRGGNCADNLEQHVEPCVLAAYPVAKPCAESDGGINVAAGDVAYAIGHCDNGKTEREGDGKLSAGVTATHVDGGTATHQNEHKRSDQFSKILFHTYNNLELDFSKQYFHISTANIIKIFFIHYLNASLVIEVTLSAMIVNEMSKQRNILCRLTF